MQGPPGARGKGGTPFELPQTPSASATVATTTVAELPSATRALLDEINRLRAQGAQCGSERKAPAPPVSWSPLLQQAAERHVRDMAPRRGGSIGHAGSDGSDVGARVQGTGYRWSSVGENVAAGNATASATLVQWMASPGHCNNIMDRDFAEVAVAGLHLPGTHFNHYWVMVLAHPWPPVSR